MLGGERTLPVRARSDAVLSAACRAVRETLPEPAFITEEQAGALISLSPRTLEKYRRAGGVPKECWFFLGKHLRYRRAALIERAHEITGIDRDGRPAAGRREP